MALMKEEAFDAALAEFLRSQELYQTRGNTQNAAVCLVRLRRFDEALEMFERLLAKFPNLTAAERTQIEAEITALRARIGTVEILVMEPGATVVVDGRTRGTTPLPGPIRVSTGSHVVRVFKEGFAPLEQRVEVASRQNTPIEGRLLRLRQSGRLLITEPTGKVVDVVVDGVVVGKTPWEGELSVGEHAVVLRGHGKLGTQPSTAPVRAGEVTTLRLAVEALDAELRVQPTPANAAVAIDGVAVGRGVWDGRLRAGTHRVEVAAEGFATTRRQVSIEPGGRELAVLELERDASSPLWRAANPPRVTFDLDVAPAFSPSFGGDLSGGSRSLAVGGLAVLHGGYQLSSGIGFAVDLGTTVMRQSISDRAGTLKPRGLEANDGTISDDLVLVALLAGVSASLHRGTTWPLLLRLGGGILLGNMSDSRSGTFTTATRVDALGNPVPYEVGSISESSRMTYAYVAPTVRLGYRVSERVELGVAAQALLLFSLQQPTWTDEQFVLAGACGPAADACEGEAEFGEQTLAGKAIVLLAPGIELRFAF